MIGTRVVEHACLISLGFNMSTVYEPSMYSWLATCINK